MAQETVQLSIPFEALADALFKLRFGKPALLTRREIM